MHVLIPMLVSFGPYFDFVMRRSSKAEFIALIASREYDLAKLCAGARSRASRNISFARRRKSEQASYFATAMLFVPTLLAAGFPAAMLFHIQLWQRFDKDFERASIFEPL